MSALLMVMPFQFVPEPKMDDYLTKRGLDSAKVPVDWMPEPTQ